MRNGLDRQSRMFTSTLTPGTEQRHQVSLAGKQLRIYPATPPNLSGISQNVFISLPFFTSPAHPITAFTQITSTSVTPYTRTNQSNFKLTTLINLGKWTKLEISPRTPWAVVMTSSSKAEEWAVDNSSRAEELVEAWRTRCLTKVCWRHPNLSSILQFHSIGVAPC